MSVLARRSTAPVEAKDFSGKSLQRYDGLCGPHTDRLLGHAEDHATGLILSDGAGTRLAHRKQPAGTVVAHAGHDDPQRIRAGAFGH